MKIVRLTSENVKRLKAVRITPDGSAVVIGGRNGQGKTSVLDSIAIALGGKREAPSVPIRQGECHARVVAELDSLVVIRKFTAGGASTLTVESTDGKKYSSPQKVLDELVGKLTFDPLAFSRMPPREQRETVRSLAGLDFTDFDNERRTLLDHQLQHKRELDRLGAELERLPSYIDGIPGQEVSVVELAQELENLQRISLGNVEERRKLQYLRLRAEAVDVEIEELEQKLAEKRNELAKIIEDGKAQRALVDGLTDPDTEVVRKRIAAAEDTNRAVRSNAARVKVEESHEHVARMLEHCRSRIEEIDEAKRAAIAKASFPIPGLGFDDNGVTFNGLPWEQASGAEQLRASVAIALALNPKLRVMLIRDGSLLDDESLRMLAELAEAADAQVWIERVSSDGAGCSVVIEDGEVKSA